MNLDERFGGLTSSIPHFCRALTQTGRMVGHLAAFCEADESAPASLPSDALYRFPIGRRVWTSNRQLHQQLGDLIRKAAIVHIHGLWREHSAITSSLCRKFKIPYVVSAHGMLEPWALNNRRWKKRLYLAAIEGSVLRNATGLRALTDAETSDYRALKLRNSIEVIPNGIDPQSEESPTLFLDAFPQLMNQRLILFLGRIHPKKGIDILCRAWAQIERQLPEVHLVIAGPDEDGTADELRSLVRELKIAGRVTFTGMLRGSLKRSALAASSLFILPSHSEGFSVAILEALGAGLPVIASRGCHFPEIPREACGWEILAQEIDVRETLGVALSLSPEMLRRMGENGRRLVSRDFTWSRVGERAADVLLHWAESP